MIKKRIVLTILTICFSLCMTGCGEALYSMTPEEEELITLYAAKMVAKYNENTPRGIANARVREGELDEAYGLASDVDEGPEEQEEAYEAQIDLSQIDQITPEAADVEESAAVEENSSLGDTIAIPNMEFTVTSFNVSSEFAASSSFVLTEAVGKKYLVLYLSGTNTSDADISFADYKAADYSLTINGTYKSKSQYSFLDNDLSIFSGSVAAGKTMDYILVFQFEDKAIGDISAITLEVTRNGSTKGTTLSIN